MDKKHELVSGLKDLSIELGRVPKRSEFHQLTKHSRYAVTKEFGSYTVLLQAAGLETYSERRKITGAIFEVPIEKHLENYEPTKSVEQPSLPTIAGISDIHWPFENQKVISRFVEYVGDVKPEKVILNGDAWDMYSHTKFPRSHNVFTPREEQALAREKNEKFWLAVKTAHPDAECIQLLGNHDVRPLKRILEAYPEAEDWVAEKLKSLFTYDGVKTIFDIREELVYGNLMIFHGYRSKLGEHRDHTLMNMMGGHTHVGGVSYRRIRGQTLWELNFGLAGDPEAKGLTYTPQRTTNWTPGFGALDKLGPRFIPV